MKEMVLRRGGFYKELFDWMLLRKKDASIRSNMNEWMLLKEVGLLKQKECNEKES